jgi:hypothetical protein
MPADIRRIRPTEAEAVTDLWDEAGRSVPDGEVPLDEPGEELFESLGFEREAIRLALYRDA